MINKIIFPIPYPPHYSAELFAEKLIFVPRDQPNLVSDNFKFKDALREVIPLPDKTTRLGKIYTLQAIFFVKQDFVSIKDEIDMYKEAALQTSTQNLMQEPNQQKAAIYRSLSQPDLLKASIARSMSQPELFKSGSLGALSNLSTTNKSITKPNKVKEALSKTLMKAKYSQKGDDEDDEKNSKKLQNISKKQRIEMQKAKMERLLISYGQQNSPRRKKKKESKSHSPERKNNHIKVQFNQPKEEVKIEQVSQPVDIKLPSFVPCLFLPNYGKNKKLMICFHSNNEDIGSAFKLYESLNQELNVNILGVEYPGYGIYNEKEISDPQMRGPCEAKIFDDATLVLEFVLAQTGINIDDIIVFGRSLGSGPATYLASNYKVGAVVLMSPYTGIRDVAGSKFGELGVFVNWLIPDTFNNLSRMRKITSPIFILHGQKDSVIPFYQGEKLFDASKMPKFLHSPSTMTHNKYDVIEDLVEPLQNFLIRYKVLPTEILKEAEQKQNMIQFDKQYYSVPIIQKQ